MAQFCLQMLLKRKCSINDLFHQTRSWKYKNSCSAQEKTKESRRQGSYEKSTCRKLFTHSTISDHEIIWTSIFLLDLILIPKKSWKVGHFYCVSWFINLDWIQVFLSLGRSSSLGGNTATLSSKDGTKATAAKDTMRLVNSSSSLVLTKAKCWSR